MREPARSESQDARAGWTIAAVVVVLLLVYLGMSAGLMERSRDSTSEKGARTPAPVVETPPTPIDDLRLAPEDLRDFGELGVLPGLLDDFSTVPDCDFDDALSTCH